jgi:hypothetical protein
VILTGHHHRLNGRITKKISISNNNRLSGRRPARKARIRPVVPPPADEQRTRPFGSPTVPGRRPAAGPRDAVADPPVERVLRRVEPTSPGSARGRRGRPAEPSRASGTPPSARTEVARGPCRRSTPGRATRRRPATSAAPPRSGSARRPPPPVRCGGRRVARARLGRRGDPRVDAEAGSRRGRPRRRSRRASRAAGDSTAAGRKPRCSPRPAGPRRRSRSCLRRFAVGRDRARRRSADGPAGRQPPASSVSRSCDSAMRPDRSVPPHSASAASAITSGCSASGSSAAGRKPRRSRRPAGPRRRSRSGLRPRPGPGSPRRASRRRSADGPAGVSLRRAR